MSHPRTHHSHTPAQGPLARLIGGLAPRSRGPGRPAEERDGTAPLAVAPVVRAPVLDRPSPADAGWAADAGRLPVLVPAWQGWAERRRAETVPTPRGAARPTAPWAAVRLHDGRTVTVTSTVLLGRAPAARMGETPGGLLTVADPQRSVSKTHLAVGVDGSGAWVVDRSSTNGTVVTLPDGSRILCVPERRVRLVPGASVAFGDAALTLTAVARHHATDEESTP